MPTSGGSWSTSPGRDAAWCRVLEARTFTDAEVVALSRKYVCVELHTDRDGALADQLHIDSIPRSIVLLPDGSTVDERVGYIPATEYRIVAGGRTGEGSRGRAQACSTGRLLLRSEPARPRRT